MDRTLSRSVPFLPRYQSVSPARSPRLDARRVLSMRCLSQPATRISYIDGDPTRGINYTHLQQSPSPCRKYNIHLISSKKSHHLVRSAKSLSASDLRSSHVYSSLDDLFSRSKRPNQPSDGVVSCEDIYHKTPFFPDVTPSESGVDVGEEGSVFGVEDDNASQHSYASSGADMTIDSELDFSGQDGGHSRERTADGCGKDELDFRLKWRPLERRSSYDFHSSDSSRSSPASYAEVRKHELMSAHAGDFDKIQSRFEALKIQIPGATTRTRKDHVKYEVSSTPLAQSTPHVSPRGHRESQLSIKACWNVDDPADDAHDPTRPKAARVLFNHDLSGFDLLDATDINSSSEGAYSDISISSIVSPGSRHLKVEGGTHQVRSELHSSSSTTSHADSGCFTDSFSHLTESSPPMSSIAGVMKGKTCGLDGAGQDGGKEELSGGEWYAVYNIGSARERAEKLGGPSHVTEANASPTKVNIPLINAGKHAQEKLRNRSQSTPSPPQSPSPVKSPSPPQSPSPVKSSSSPQSPSPVKSPSPPQSPTLSVVAIPSHLHNPDPFEVGKNLRPVQTHDSRSEQKSLFERNNLRGLQGEEGTVAKVFHGAGNLESGGDPQSVNKGKSLLSKWDIDSGNFKRSGLAWGDLTSTQINRSDSGSAEIGRGSVCGESILKATEDSHRGHLEVSNTNENKDIDTSFYCYTDNQNNNMKQNNSDVFTELLESIALEKDDDLNLDLPKHVTSAINNSEIWTNERGITEGEQDSSAINRSGKFPPSSRGDCDNSCQDHVVFATTEGPVIDPHNVSNAPAPTHELVETGVEGGNTHMNNYIDWAASENREFPPMVARAGVIRNFSPADGEFEYAHQTDSKLVVDTTENDLMQIKFRLSDIIDNSKVLESDIIDSLEENFSGSNRNVEERNDDTRESITWHAVSGVVTEACGGQQDVVSRGAVDGSRSADQSLGPCHDKGRFTHAAVERAELFLCRERALITYRRNNSQAVLAAVVGDWHSHQLDCGAVTGVTLGVHTCDSGVVTSVTSDVLDSGAVTTGVTSDVLDSVAVTTGVTSDVLDRVSVTTIVTSDVLDSGTVTKGVTSDALDSVVFTTGVTSDVLDSVAVTTSVTSDVLDIGTVTGVTASIPVECARPGSALTACLNEERAGRDGLQHEVIRADDTNLTCVPIYRASPVQGGVPGDLVKLHARHSTGASSAGDHALYFTESPAIFNTRSTSPAMHYGNPLDNLQAQLSQITSCPPSQGHATVFRKDNPAWQESGEASNTQQDVYGDSESLNSSFEDMEERCTYYSYTVTVKASDEPTQNVEREEYDNCYSYDVTRDASGDNCYSYDATKDVPSYTPRRHSLQLLKSGQLRASSLWTLQEESESVLETPKSSPKKCLAGSYFWDGDFDSEAGKEPGCSEPMSTSSLSVEETTIDSDSDFESTDRSSVVQSREKLDNDFSVVDKVSVNENEHSEIVNSEDKSLFGIQEFSPESSWRSDHSGQFPVENQQDGASVLDLLSASLEQFCGSGSIHDFSMSSEDKVSVHKDVSDKDVLSIHSWTDDLVSEGSSRLCDFDASIVSSCSPTPSDFSEASMYTSTGTAEVKTNYFDYDNPPVSSENKIETSFEEAPETTTNLMVEKFDQLLKQFDALTSPTGAITEFDFVKQPSEGTQSTQYEDLYKAFTNEDAEKMQNHVCIVVEDDNMCTYRFKQFLKKSHTKRKKGRKILRFLTKLGCVSEMAHSPEASPHRERAPAGKDLCFSAGEPRFSQSAIRTQQSLEPQDTSSPYSSNHSLASVRSRADSAYSSLSESVLSPTTQGRSRTSTRGLSGSSVSSVFYDSSSGWESSEVNTPSLAQTPVGQLNSQATDKMSALSDVFEQLDICQGEIDTALLGRLRHGHNKVEHK